MAGTARACVSRRPETRQAIGSELPRREGPIRCAEIDLMTANLLDPGARPDGIIDELTPLIRRHALDHAT
jgi:hypothetical protein